MSKRFVPILLLATLICLGSAACEHKKTQAEVKAERVKAFRKKQMEKAIKSYQEIATKYADSEYAPKAKERLQHLKAGETPAKK
jgi:hypothetical protein